MNVCFQATVLTIGLHKEVFVNLIYIRRKSVFLSCPLIILLSSDTPKSHPTSPEPPLWHILLAKHGTLEFLYDKAEGLSKYINLKINQTQQNWNTQNFMGRKTELIVSAFSHHILFKTGVSKLFSTFFTKDHMR